MNKFLTACFLFTMFSTSVFAGNEWNFGNGRRGGYNPPPPHIHGPHCGCQAGVPYQHQYGGYYNGQPPMLPNPYVPAEYAFQGRGYHPGVGGVIPYQGYGYAPYNNNYYGNSPYNNGVVMAPPGYGNPNLMHQDPAVVGNPVVSVNPEAGNVPKQYPAGPGVPGGTKYKQYGFTDDDVEYGIKTYKDYPIGDPRYTPQLESFYKSAHVALDRYIQYHGIAPLYKALPARFDGTLLLDLDFVGDNTMAKASIDNLNDYDIVCRRIILRGSTFSGTPLEVVKENVLIPANDGTVLRLGANSNDPFGIFIVARGRIGGQVLQDERVRLVLRVEGCDAAISNSYYQQ